MGRGGRWQCVCVGDGGGGSPLTRQCHAIHVFRICHALPRTCSLVAPCQSPLSPPRAARGKGGGVGHAGRRAAMSMPCKMPMRRDRPDGGIRLASGPCCLLALAHGQPAPHHLERTSPSFNRISSELQHYKEAPLKGGAGARKPSAMSGCCPWCKLRQTWYS